MRVPTMGTLSGRNGDGNGSKLESKTIDHSIAMTRFEATKERNDCARMKELGDIERIPAYASIFLPAKDEPSFSKLVHPLFRGDERNFQKNRLSVRGHFSLVNSFFSKEAALINPLKFDKRYLETRVRYLDKISRKIDPMILSGRNG